MFRNFLKVAFRNLWKHKGYNIINILGMALGFAAFLLILFYVNYERSYDKVFPDYEHVVKAGLTDGKKSGSSMSAGFGPQAAGRFAEIKAYTRINFFISKTLWTAGNRSNYVNSLYGVDSTFFNVFEYRFVYGNPDHALDKPKSLVISDKMSRQFFGNTNPVGRSITLNKKDVYTVTGVFKTPGGPTTFHPDGFEKLNTHGRETQLFPMNYYTFFRIQENANIALLQQKLTAFIREWAGKINPNAGFDRASVLLDPVSQLHFSDVPGAGEIGHPALLSMLLIVGIILLLIASVNFINLSVTAAMGRAREVGVRKVMGAGRARLRLQFYFEIFLQVFTAFLLANIFAELLKPAYAHFLDLQSLKNIAGTWDLVLYGGAALILVTAIAGAYPAFYLSRFDPSRVLKGSFSSGKSGTFTQRILLLSQITLTTIFLVGVMVMARQVKYLRNINIGFQPDQVMTIPIHIDEAYDRFGSLKTELLNVPGVTAVSRVDNLPTGNGFGGNSYGYGGETRDMDFLCVDYDFAKTMGMQFMAGRPFDIQRDPDTLGHLILNQAAVKAFGIKGDPVGQALVKWGGKDEIIGVVKDFHYGSLQNHIGPLVFELHQGNWMGHALIRVNTANLDQTVLSVKKIWSRYESGFPVTYTFVDSYFDQFLKSFERQEKTVFVFALLAVLLSLFGLFALVAFSVRRRTKEMAVRKVLGASNRSILTLLNKNFIWLVISGAVLGAPLAYLAANYWLKGFAYRINMPIMPFIVAGLLAVFLTIVTVSLLAWRAAKERPVDALKYE